jgi:hypothetical protein
MVMMDHKVALEETVQSAGYCVPIFSPISLVLQGFSSNYFTPTLGAPSPGEVIQSTNHKMAIRSAIRSDGRT